MSETVYLAGAGFTRSVQDSTDWGPKAPLTRDFFQRLLIDGRLRDKLDGIRQRTFVDVLLEHIKHLWHLSLDDLETQGFDIEECLTVLESIIQDPSDQARSLDAARAAVALRALILMYMGDLHPPSSPAGAAFGREVLGLGADVITLNYDTAAERCLESASGFSSKVSIPHDPADPLRQSVGDADLDASHFAWKAALAYGVKFDNVPIPIAGVPIYVTGARYYSHPAHQLYTRNRVLKLHGSVDWLRPTGQSMYPQAIRDRLPQSSPPAGLTLSRHTTYWMAETPGVDGWVMDPVIVPPQAVKVYQQHPLPDVWQLALDSLRDCQRVVVIGYSFPPTDFRLRRLLLQAFADHSPSELIVVNPDTATIQVVQRLTHFSRAVVTCPGLCELYGVPGSYMPGRQPTARGIQGSTT